MAGIDDIINHSNFGRLLYENSDFAKAFRSELLPSMPGLETIAGQIRMSADADGKLSISVLDDTRSLAQLSGESNADFVARAVAQARDSVTRVRRYAGDTLASTQTGAQVNRRLDALSRLYGVSFEVSSVRNDLGPEGVALLRQQFGDEAFIKVDPDTSTVVRAFGRDGKPKTTDQISEMMGYFFDETTKDKRHGALLNEIESELLYADGRKIKVGILPASEFLGGDEELGKQVRNHVKFLMAENPQLSYNEALEQAYETISDGALFLSEKGLQETIGQIDNEIKNIDDRIRQTSSGAELRDLRKRRKAFVEQKNNMKTAVNKGRSFNTRITNPENVLGEDQPFSLKGEATVLPQRDFEKIARRLNPDMTDEQLADIHVLGTRASVNADVRGRPRGARPQISSMTLNMDPPLKTPRSNTLTTAVFGPSINKDNFLEVSLFEEVKAAVQDIQEGRVTGRLKKIIQDLESMPVDDLSPAEVRRLQDSKAFARQVKVFLDSGGDLRGNPVMTQKLVSQIEEHFFKNSRFPMSGSHLTHLESKGMRIDSAVDSGEIGRMGLSSSGRFSLTPEDALRTRMSFGGFDFDDSFYGFYQYDSKTKRLLTFALRDPNQMGEYFIFDADIANDPNMPKAVREMFEQHKNLTKQLEKVGKKAAGSKKKRQSLDSNQIRGLIQKRNKLGAELDAYFSGRGVTSGPLSLLGTPSSIQQVDLEAMFKGDAAMRMPAAAGHTVSDESRRRYRTSRGRSFGAMDINNPRAAAQAVASEVAQASRGVNPYSIFEFKGDQYNEYYDLFKMLGTDDKVISGGSRQAGKATSGFLYNKMAEQASMKGKLGQAINHLTIIDNFIQEHLDYSGVGNVDPRIKKKVLELLETHKLSRIDREKLIDALVKDFDMDVIGQIEEMMPGNATKLGRIIRDLNQYAATEGIDFQSGIDVAVFDERMRNSTELVNNLMRGAGAEDVESLLLGVDSPIAHQAKLLGRKGEMAEKFEEINELLVKRSRGYLSDLIGEGYDPESISRAQDIISDYYQGQEALRNSDLLDRMRGLLGGDNVDDLTSRSIERRLMGALEGASGDDILAIGRVLLDSDSSLGMMMGSTEFMDSRGRTVASLFQAALTQEDTFRNINRADNLNDLVSRFFEFREGKYVMSSSAPQVIDEEQMQVLLRNKIDELYYDTSDLSARSYSPVQIQEIDNVLSNPQATSVYRGDGLMGAGMRGTADELADSVARDLPTRMRRFAMSDLMGSTTLAKSLRRGLVGIAAFAGVGITHRIVTGDRTVEESNPYPLIPKGSEYEKIANNLQFQQVPTMSNGSMSYQIRAYGSVDPTAISDSVRGVLGQGSSTIYESSAPDLGIGGSSSRSILDQRLNS